MRTYSFYNKAVVPHETIPFNPPFPDSQQLHFFGRCPSENPPKSSGTIMNMVNLSKTDLDELSNVMCAKYHNLEIHAHKVTFASKTRTTLSGISSAEQGHFIYEFYDYYN